MSGNGFKRYIVGLNPVFQNSFPDQIAAVLAGLNSGSENCLFPRTSAPLHLLWSIGVCPIMRQASIRYWRFLWYQD